MKQPASVTGLHETPIGATGADGGLQADVGTTRAETVHACIPTSGWKGDNLTKRSSNTPWYKGPTILDSLDTFIQPEKPLKKPLRVPIQDVYSITGVGTVPVGRVETGVLKDGDKVIFMPSRNQTSSFLIPAAAEGFRKPNLRCKSASTFCPRSPLNVAL
mgnify:CR=1 FL=1